jgi:hypothetical protein
MASEADLIAAIEAEPDDVNPSHPGLPPVVLHELARDLISSESR